MQLSLAIYSIMRLLRTKSYNTSAGRTDISFCGYCARTGASVPNAYTPLFCCAGLSYSLSIERTDAEFSFFFVYVVATARH